MKLTINVLSVFLISSSRAASAMGCTVTAVPAREATIEKKNTPKIAAKIESRNLNIRPFVVEGKGK
jgi:hypothetical protein